MTETAPAMPKRGDPMRAERRVSSNFRLSRQARGNIGAIVRAEERRGLRLSLTQAVELALAEAAKKRR